MANIFSVDFEDNRITDPSTFRELAIVNGGVLEVNAAAALRGSLGLEVTPLYPYVAYIAQYVFPKVKRFRQAFYFDPNSIAMGDGEFWRLALDMHVYETPYRIVLVMYLGEYNLRFYVRQDDDVEIMSINATELIDQQHCIEIDWKASSAPGANDGFMSIWVDEVFQETIANIDNDE
jgi:hypothetical protein